MNILLNVKEYGESVKFREISKGYERVREGSENLKKVSIIVRGVYHDK